MPKLSVLKAARILGKRGK